MTSHRLRLQGGPFDGHGHVIQRPDIDEPPERIWVVKCAFCGSHWSLTRQRKSELYRRDIEERGVWVYVFTDRSIEPERVAERELVPAGGIPEENKLDEGEWVEFLLGRAVA